MAQFEGSLPRRDASTGAPRARGISGWAVGLTAFASVLMIILGIFHVLEAISAIIDSSFYAVPERFPLNINVATWGWLHLTGGVIVLLSGLWLLTGDKYARAVAVILAALSAAGNFLSIPYYPAWSIVLIALDVAIIWAVTSYVRYVNSDQQSGPRSHASA